MDKEKFNIEVPVVENGTAKLYVNGQYKGEINEIQLFKLKVQILDYLKKTKDESILDTFYFVGHEDSPFDDMPEEIVKTTMNKHGYLKDELWELNHTTRALIKLINDLNEMEYDTKWNK